MRAPERKRRFHWRRLAGIAIGIAVVVATFVFVLPRIADYQEVWGVVKELSWWQVALLVGVTAVNLATYPPPWMVTLRGLHFRQAFVLTQASTAATYVAPGGAAPGIALSFAMLRAWGFGIAAITLAAALTGAWNQLSLLGFPAIALALLTLTGGNHALLQTAALIGFGVFVAVVAGFAGGLSSPRLARWVGNLAARLVTRALRVIRKAPVTWDGASFVEFRARALDLLHTRWHVLTVATLAGQLTVFAVMFACLRVLEVPGSEVSAIEAFAAWSLARLLGSLPLTPGGLGVVELALTTLLVSFGGNRAGVVAAVLVYRFLTIVPTLVLGLLGGATWKRHHPGAVEPEPELKSGPTR